MEYKHINGRIAVIYNYGDLLKSNQIKENIANTLGLETRDFRILGLLSKVDNERLKYITIEELKQLELDNPIVILIK